MKILVCISKSPDTTSKIAFTDGDTKFDENGVQYIVNPYDEWYALVRALVISCAKGMAEQRIPNMRGIMAARTKPLNVVAPVATGKIRMQTN